MCNQNLVVSVSMSVSVSVSVSVFVSERTPAKVLQDNCQSSKGNLAECKRTLGRVLKNTCQNAFKKQDAWVKETLAGTGGNCWELAENERKRGGD